MTKQDPWFFMERAAAFTKLVLTKRHDVRPHAGTDGDSNLLVEIRQNGNSTRRRLFGVQIVPFMDLPDTRDADERTLAHPGTDAVEVEFPLCVFVIGVRKPEGIYRWIVEPVVEDGRALLNRDVEANWQPLDEAGVAHLIGQVNAWYDALNRGPPPKPSRRHAKTES